MAEVTGEIRFQGENLATCPDSRMRQIRGNRIAMVFQEPMTALNPVLTVGEQVAEALRLHRGLSHPAAWREAAAALARVGFPDAAARLSQYPHQLSGGLRQRALMAMALACEPELLIADEPTTALDVTIQAQILALLAKLKAELGLAVLFITHNLGIVAQTADRVAVMYAGLIVEQAPTAELFRQPDHPYTQGLLNSVPRLDFKHPPGEILAPIKGHLPAEPPSGCLFRDRCPLAHDRCLNEPPWVEVNPGHWCAAGIMSELLEAHDLCRYFRLAGAWGKGPLLKAVDGVSLTLFPGETLGLVGESGCGKSTLGRLALALLPPTCGRIVFNGEDLAQVSHKRLKELRREIQIIFQDPYSSLNPRMTVGQILEEPYIIHNLGTRPERRAWVAELLREVGLTDEVLDRYPHEFSGGQRQRLGIARALALKPRLIVADEPVSALDVSIQAQILNLLAELQQRHGLTYLFISHDLSVISQISNRVAVMYVGRLMELATREVLAAARLHPYTEALLAAVPRPTAERTFKPPALKGEPPSPVNVPPGCPFHPRCPEAQFPLCQETVPAFRETAPDHWVACHFR